MAATRLIALTLTATMFAVAGCGGSASDKSSASLTRAELITKADAICRRVNTLHNSITITSPTDEAPALATLAAYERSALTALSRLRAPTSMAANWNEIITNFRAMAEDTKKVAESTRSNNLKDVRSLGLAFNDARQRISVVATHDGFHSCPQIGS